MARLKLELPAQFRFRTDIPVRITDINYGGHLGNDSVISLIHEARMRFFRKYNMEELNIDGIGIVISDLAVIYRAEGFYGDILTIHVTPTDLNRKGCDFYYLLKECKNGKEVARAKTGIVFVDYGARKTVEAPARFVRTFFRDAEKR